MSIRILVVDDDPTILAALDFSLTFEGFGVTTAREGAEALSHAVATLPDVILLDMMMPNMSGLEVVQVIRQDPRIATTPVVMLTAKAGDADAWSCWRAGIDSYVSKPFDIEALVGEIIRVAGAREGVAA